MFAW